MPVAKFEAWHCEVSATAGLTDIDRKVLDPVAGYWRQRAERGYAWPLIYDRLTEATGTEPIAISAAKRSGQAQDVIVAEQMKGFTVPCKWADFGRIELQPGQTVSAVQLKGATNRQLFCPEGWKYEGSLSCQFGFVPTGEEQNPFGFCVTRTAWMST